MKILPLVSACLLLLAATPLCAAEPGLSLELEAQALTPGRHVWGEDSGEGALALLVSVPEQRLYVYRDGVLVGAAAVSTGASAKPTPPGEFRILQKARHHRSNLYSNTPMPFMQRLTWDGIAIHAGRNPGYPASHGCIRLPAGFARRLFALTRLDVPVSVVDYELQPSLALRIEGLDLLGSDNAPAVPAPTQLALLDYSASIFAIE